MRKINNILWLGLGSVLAFNIATSDAKTIDDYVNCIRNNSRIYKLTPNEEYKTNWVVKSFFIYSDELNEKEVKKLAEEIGYGFKISRSTEPNTERNKIDIYVTDYLEAKDLFDVLWECSSGKTEIIGVGFSAGER